MTSKKLKKSLLANDGQISIMIGVMITTFILFFAFVINVGMLVNAKINLQNAADLAAYAGAAVQARQLTQISYLNYEMRRQYKKFLFRTYVLGNMSIDSFPRSSGQNGPMIYETNTRDASLSNNYGVPTTCVIFNSKDNFCHLSKLGKVQTPGSSFGLDSITDTLNDQLRSIEQIRQSNCQSIGMTNKLLNILWMFNTDPDLENLPDSLNADQARGANMIRSLAGGLGIIPKEIILRSRISSLESYVNAPPQKSLNLEAIDGLAQSADPSKFERSVQAFYSAYYSLGNHTFAGSSITMDELLPGDSSNALLLSLKDIQQKIDVFAIDFVFDGGAAGLQANQNISSSTDPRDCIAAVIPVSTKAPVKVGVYKDPSVLTYYAIRLKAKAQVLFSPFGDIELKAYAAAQPFGSRIGPADATFGFDFDVPFAVKAFSLNQGFSKVSIPNLAIKSSDTSNQGQGWDRLEVLGEFFQKLSGAGGNGNSDAIGVNEIEQAYVFAMAPNPWESGKYNIMTDEGFDSFSSYFGIEPRGQLGQTSITAFWAPVFTQEKIAAASQFIKDEINRLFDNNIKGNIGTGGGRDPILAIQSSLQQGMEAYFGKLLSGNGELGEGNNIVKITNAFRQPGSLDLVAGNPEIYLTTDPRTIKTSWNSVNDGNLRAEGRSGYSVKFVSFNSLREDKIPTNGQDLWSNSLGIDDEADQDLPFIRH